MRYFIAVFKVFRKRVQTLVCLRHVRNDFVQEVDNAAVLERRSRHDGNGIHRGDTDTDTAYRFFARKLARFKIFVQKELVVFRRRFHKTGFHFLDLVFHVFGNGNFLRSVFLEQIRAFLQGVDTTLHLAVFHDRDLNGRDLPRIFCVERLHRAEVISVFFIHAVDEDDKRFAKF